MPHKNPENQKAYYEANKDRIKARKRQWQLDNKEKRSAYHKEWQAKQRRLKSASYVATCLRSRLNTSVKRRYKAGSAVRDLGCSIADFKVHIEKQFTEGMSWDNHGEWHLDHITPLASFDLSDRQQFLVACHYSNYQPLWKLDNLCKGASVT